MYNSYGERRVRYTRVPLSALMESVLQAGAVPEGAELVGVVLQEPVDGQISGYEVRLICAHDSFPVCLAGEQMPEMSEATAAPANPAEPAEPTTTAPESTATAPESTETEAPTEAEPATAPAEAPAEE